MNFNDACFRFSQELARSFMLSSSRHPFLSQLFRRTGGNMLLLQSERALMFVPWLFLTWMFCALLRIFKVTGAEGETRTLRVASPQTCSSFNWTFQTEVGVITSGLCMSREPFGPLRECETWTLPVDSA